MAWDAGWWSTASWQGAATDTPATSGTSASTRPAKRCARAVTGDAWRRWCRRRRWCARPRRWRSRAESRAGSVAQGGTVVARRDWAGRAVGGSGDDGDAAGDGQECRLRDRGIGDDLESGRGVHLDGHPRRGRCRASVRCGSGFTSTHGRLRRGDWSSERVSWVATTAPWERPNTRVTRWWRLVTGRAVTRPTPIPSASLWKTVFINITL